MLTDIQDHMTKSDTPQKSREPKFVTHGRLQYLSAVYDAKVWRCFYSPIRPDYSDRMEAEELIILFSFEYVVSLIRFSSSSKDPSCSMDNFPIDILKQLAETVVK